MNYQVPKLAYLLLRLFLRDGLKRQRLNDFEEMFYYIAENESIQSAQRWYWKHILKSIPKLIFDSIYWGIAMFKNYFTIALRNIRKYKTYSAINILGLATGIAFFILILTWVFNEYNYDKFHSKGDRIYRVLQHIKYDNIATWAITQGPLGEALKETTPEIENYARFRYTRWPVKYNNNYFELDGLYTDQSMWDIFDFKFLNGDINSALVSPYSIVLTKTIADNIFGNTDPIGKVINVRGQYDLTVTGIVEDIPGNSHLKFSFLSTMEFANESGNLIDQWTNSGVYTYLLLKENADPLLVTNKIYDFLDERPTLEKWEKLTLQPLDEIHISSGIGYEVDETVNFYYILIFSFAAFFVLLIACINFMNLSTARAAMRAKEVGLRKVIGAKKSQLIRQFLSESLILTFISLIIALLLALILMPMFNSIAGKSFSFTFLLQPKIIVSLFAILIMTGLLAGSYPALVLSSFKPVKVLRSITGIYTRGAKLRKFLVVLQYTVTAVLLIGTFVIYSQIQFMRNMPLGYDKENIVYFNANKTLRDNFDSFRQELLNYSSIKNICRSNDTPLSGFTFSNALWRWEGYDPEKPILFRATLIDDNFFDTYGMKIKYGRNFSKKFPSDGGSVILNESAQKIIGYNDPIGRNIFYDNKDSLLSFPIIGIVEDYNFRSLRSPIEPLILLMGDNSSRIVSLKIDSQNIPATLSTITSVHEKICKESTLNINFLDASLNKQYTLEESIG
ncbi:ABC transporter permease, partial [Bacteroidota bacterium]